MIWYEGLLKIIDKLIDLFKMGDERRRRAFSEHIDPLFVDMTLVHKDYLETFEDILEQLRQRPQPPEVVHNLILEKKAVLEHLRVKVNALAEVYAEQPRRGGPPDAATRFFEAVLDYFQAASGKAPGYRGRLTDLLQFLNENYFETEQVGKYAAIAMVYKYRTESGKLVGDDFGYKLYEVIEAVKQRWNGLTVAYAEAKVELLK